MLFIRTSWVQIFLIIIFFNEIQWDLLGLLEFTINDYVNLFTDLTCFVDHLIHIEALFIDVVLKLTQIKSAPVLEIRTRFQKFYEPFYLLGLYDTERLFVVILVQDREVTRGVSFYGGTPGLVV